MKVDFDPDKDAGNREKHGVSLVFGERVLEDTRAVFLPTIRSVDGEDRYKVIGSVDDRLWTAVLVFRGEVVRFISVRRSNPGERREYGYGID